jgi:ATP-binding cassette subfamily B protein
MVDDTPLTGIRISEVRRHIVVVSQFPAFLTDTVRANLLLGRADASDAELEAAARRTGIWPVLETKSPHAPLDCPMMREAGKDFSGGERRLLAVTRALLRRPTLLLLDEPTTGIDAINLESVLHALRAAAEGVTTVLIEHNLDFVSAMADTVCVLDKGHFVEVGAPAELATASGLYHELVEARRRIAEGGRSMETTSYPASRLASAGRTFANMSAEGGPPPDVGSLPVSPLSGKKKVMR